LLRSSLIGAIAASFYLLHRRHVAGSLSGIWTCRTGNFSR
jgi:hypothetical protein